MTTPDNPAQDPPPEQPDAARPEGGEAAGVDPREALKGLEGQPRIDEHGYPTAYTAVPPPLGAQQPQQPKDGQPAQEQREQQPQNQGAYQASAQQPYGGQGGEGGQQPHGGRRPGPQDQPPPGYGYPPPPPGYQSYGTPYGADHVPGMPPYARWGQRAGAWLIDNLLAVVGISILDASYYDWGYGVRVFSWILMVAGVVWAVYNAYLAGQTGQSTGKRLMGIRLARYVDGQVVGPAFGILRLFMNAVFWAICVIPGILNYLWPLWDRKSQTWSDKIASSVVVQAR